MALPNRVLMITLDDFGSEDCDINLVSKAVNRQLVTNISIMGNRVEPFNETEKYIISKCCTGVHINLIEGRPISKASQVRSIINKNGCFLDYYEFLFKFITKRINSAEVQLEINNQIKNLQDLGINIQYIDSHKHLHSLINITNVFITCCQKNQIENIRNCRRFNFILRNESRIDNFIKSRFRYPLSNFSWLIKADIDRIIHGYHINYPHGLICFDFDVLTNFPEHYKYSLNKALRSLPSGVYEINIHLKKDSQLSTQTDQLLDSNELIFKIIKKFSVQSYNQAFSLNDMALHPSKI